jgi:hypothetical protein
MNSQERNQSKTQVQQTSTFSNDEVQGMLKSYPFVLQSKPNTGNLPDLKTSLMRAEKYGHHLNKTNLANQSATIAVQPKLDGQTVQLALDDDVLAERRRQEVARELRPELTPDIFKRDFMEESTDLADDVITGRRHGRGGQTLGFHVTRGENVPGISSKGLDPGRGGEGGASELREGTDFVEQSRGYIHYSDNTFASGYYGDHMRSQGHQPTLLGIRRPEHVERDPDDPRGAYRTTQKIRPNDITNLGGGVTNNAIDNYQEANQRFLNKLQANTSALREAHKIPQTREKKEERKDAVRKANEERRMLHIRGRDLTGPEPFADESVPLGKKRTEDS